MFMRLVKGLVGLCFFSLVLIPGTALSQDKVLGISTDGSPTDTTFTTTMYLDSNVTPADTATDSSNTRISTSAVIDTTDVGKTAAIFMVRIAGDEFSMRSSSGDYVPWSGLPEELVPNISAMVLPSALESELYSGTLNVGDYEFYIGYQVAGESALIYTPIPFRFSVTASLTDSSNIIGPKEALVGEEIHFSLNPDLVEQGVSYAWSFDDGTADSGTSTSHSYDAVNRHLISVSRSDSSDVYYHHINIARAYDDTLYPQYLTNSLAPPIETREFTWNECGSSWEVYQSKYHKLFVEASISESVRDDDIGRLLLFSDYIFDIYSEFIGWEFLPEPQALDTFICDQIPGGGTGTGGSFYPSGIFPDFYVGDELTAAHWEVLIHEILHLWDFRGGVWLGGQDTAHAFTSGMEPIINHVLGTGGNMSAIIGERTVGNLDPNYTFNHYYRLSLKRFLDNPNLDWSTYNSDEFLDLEFDKLPLPENKEHMLVPGGFLMSIYAMHGASGLTAVFSELEKIMLSNPGWESGGVGYHAQEPLQRAQNWLDATSKGLQIDASDYFDYWKFPALDNSISNQYSRSDKLDDQDGDGVSPLHGDLDDNDASIYPYAPELVDGKDNNQDGLIDENTFSEIGGDISTLDVALPFFAEGDISSLEDEDNFSFNMPQAGYVILNLYAKDSDTAVEYEPDSDRLSSILQGSVWIDGNHVFPVILDAISAPHVFGSWYLDAGSHTLTINAEMLQGIDADVRNPNPGSYEVQMFINTHEATTTVDSVLGLLYPDS